MKTIRLLIDLTYDDEFMHGSDPAAEWWFEEDVLGGGSLVLVDRGDMGDDVGHVKIVDRNPPPVDDKTSPTATDDKSSPVAEDPKTTDRGDVGTEKLSLEDRYRILLEEIASAECSDPNYTCSAIKCTPITLCPPCLAKEILSGKDPVH